MGWWRNIRRVLNQKQEKFDGFYVQHWSPEFKTNVNREFIAQLEKHKFPAAIAKQGVILKGHVAMGFDTVTFFINAFKKAKKNKNGKYLKDSIRDTVIDGVTGNFILFK